MLNLLRGRVRWVLIFGASTDKDIAGMVDGLLPLSTEVIVTRSRNPRAADVSALAAEFSRRGVKAKEAETVGTAVEAALREAGRRDLVCVTGSLFVVAEAIDYYNRRAAQESTAD